MGDVGLPLRQDLDYVLSVAYCLQIFIISIMIKKQVKS